MVSCPSLKTEPFLTSSEQGYDVSDYREIHDQYGTMADMERLIAAIHERNMKIVMDLVVNHTSDQVFAPNPRIILYLTPRLISMNGFNSLEVRKKILFETGMFGDRAVRSMAFDIHRIIGEACSEVRTDGVLHAILCVADRNYLPR